MYTYWSILIGMLIMAMAFILWPLLRNKSFVDYDRKTINVTIYQTRLLALQAELRAGNITQNQFQREKNILDHNLLEDVDTASKALPVNKPRRQWLALVILLFLFPLAAWFFYQQWGESAKYNAWVDDLKIQQQLPQDLSRFGTPKQIIKKMELAVEQKPNDPLGWFLLGRLYFSQGYFSKAEAAFAKSNQLEPNKAETILNYAKASFYANNKMLDSTARSELVELLKQRPQILEAQSLLAMDDYQRGDYNAAIMAWRKILVSLPEASDEAQVVLNAIREAKIKRDGDNATLTKLTVNVSLDEALKNKVKPDDTVFILARAVSGPKVPLAVVRVKVKDLPTTVSLSDAEAMTPQFTLSKYANIEIVARVSRHGQPIAKAGDFEGKSSIVNSKQVVEPIPVMINKEID